ncbi:hypothetical protein V6N13_016598 [Hibiscus sabdariffa]|uniref:Isochorismatase-like domain-containing protein n=2 Tax=Hibiscus sabdariffa TaxID=183260 RepID=A0ABR2NMZ2_9ROSI
MADKWKQTALLNDFILEDRPARVNGGKAIVPNVIKAVEIARDRGILVVWVVRENDYLGRDVELFRRHFYLAGKQGPAVKGSEGAKLVDGLVIKQEDYKLVKTRFSAFFATHLHSFLQSSKINNLVIVGVQTPNCIRQTVFDAVSLDFGSVTIIADATVAATPEIHNANITDMKNIGVATPTLQEWCEADA